MRDTIIYPNKTKYGKMLHDIKIGRKVYAKKDEVLKVRFINGNLVCFWTAKGELIQIGYNSFEYIKEDK